jgi:hypothetical protein
MIMIIESDDQPHDHAPFWRKRFQINVLLRLKSRALIKT